MPLIFSMRSPKLHFMTFLQFHLLNTSAQDPLCAAIPPCLHSQRHCKCCQGNLAVTLCDLSFHPALRGEGVCPRVCVHGWLLGNCSWAPVAHVMVRGAPRRSTVSQEPICLLRYRSQCQEKLYPWVSVSLITSFECVTGTRLLMTLKEAIASARRVQKGPALLFSAKDALLEKG